MAGDHPEYLLPRVMLRIILPKKPPPWLGLTQAQTGTALATRRREPGGEAGLEKTGDGSVVDMASPSPLRSTFAVPPFCNSGRTPGACTAGEMTQPCPPDGAMALYSREQPQQALLHGLREKREVSARGLRGNVGSKQPVPDGENKPKVFVRQAFCPVMDPVIVGGDQYFLENPKIHPDVGMQPYIYANRKR